MRGILLREARSALGNKKSGQTLDKPARAVVLSIYEYSQTCSAEMLSAEARYEKFNFLCNFIRNDVPLYVYIYSGIMSCVESSRKNVTYMAGAFNSGRSLLFLYNFLPCRQSG